MSRADAAHTTRRAFLGTGLKASAAAALIGAAPQVASASGLIGGEEALKAYNAWLFYERKLLSLEMYPDIDPKVHHLIIPHSSAVADFHFPAYPTRWQDRPQPSTRALTVLRAVGVTV